LVRWSEPPGSEVVFVKAKKCSKNRGILNDDGTEQPTPHNIYVDDNLMADTRERMPFTLAAAVEAIFVIMGFPRLLLRPSAVAMDKWKLLMVSPIQILLGLLFNTRDMTVGVTPAYRMETCHLMKTRWHSEREAFDVKELEQLVGKLGRIGQAYRPIYHLMPQMYASIAYALRENHEYLASTQKSFQKLIKQAKKRPTGDEDEREVNFALQQVARKTHASKRKYRMPQSLKEEIVFMSKILHDNNIELSTPFGHIVPRDPDFEEAADSCKRAGGGWSVDLSFWWHLVYPKEVIDRAHLPNNKGGKLISINVLEMVCVIVNMAAAIFACHMDGIDLSHFPVLLNWCDNTSACSWVNSKCKHSLIGRRLGRLFVGLLMGTKLGIQAEWISTHLNFIADDLSRLKNEDENGDFDYAKLKLTYPMLKNCRQFQPSGTLLGMIWDILLHGSCPDPLIVKQLKPSALGQFIS
jgi:hypothetical protein